MTKTLIIIIPLLEVALVRFDFVAFCIKPLNTLVHELSHAIVALVLGNKVKDIKLNADFSGSCTTMGHSRFKQFLVSIAGYTLPAVLGYLMVRFMGTTTQSYFFYALIILGIFALALYIRNAFGVVWTLLFVGLNFSLIYFPIFAPYLECVLYAYACSLLLENVIATITLIRLSLSDSKKAGDATMLQTATYIPAFLYALGFLAFSLWMTYLSYSVIAVRFF